MIQEEINTNGRFPTVTVQLGNAYFEVPEGEYRKDSVCVTLMNGGRTPGGYMHYRTPNGNWKNWGFAHEEGFLRSTSEIINGMWLGNPNMSLKCTFELTDKAAAYVVGKDQDNVITLKVVDGVDVKVTGMTKPAEMLGATVTEAQFTYTYKFNPLGKALAEPFRSLSGSEKNGGVTDEDKMAFQLYDDGWRIMKVE
jgi:hypothetical protein